MLRLALALAAAALLGGCAVDAVTVDDDPLTKRLGESGATVQSATEELSPAGLAESLQGADLSDVRRLDRMVTRLVEYRPEKVDPA